MGVTFECLIQTFILFWNWRLFPATSVFSIVAWSRSHGLTILWSWNQNATTRSSLWHPYIIFSLFNDEIFTFVNTFLKPEWLMKFLCLKLEKCTSYPVWVVSIWNRFEDNQGKDLLISIWRPRLWRAE